MFIINQVNFINYQERFTLFNLAILAYYEQVYNAKIILNDDEKIKINQYIAENFYPFDHNNNLLIDNNRSNNNNDVRSSNNDNYNNTIKQKINILHLKDEKLSNILNSIVATNIFLDKNYISFKMQNQVNNQENNLIFAEIFVYSEKFEGTHVRASNVSRGGIRHSDRDDYREEVLGLLKSQIFKNTIIVPSGAKGCFKLRKNTNKEEVLICYKDFIRGFLDLTDNKNTAKNNQIVLKYCNFDPYLVVAADKGTASFSDYANEIAINEYNFWLNDAFASGGSHGFSHKQLGITSKGCKVSLETHLKKINKKLDSDVISVLGIGDMSGDVFGNGMILNKNLDLIAAFNNKYIYLNLPELRKKKALRYNFNERKRLFKQQLNWDQYQFCADNQYGKVYDRLEQIYLHKKVAKRLNLYQEKYIKNRNILNNELCKKDQTDILNTLQDYIEISSEYIIKAILKLNCDVIWNGGIGTYIKSSLEMQIDAKDSINNNVRINANELGAKIIVEGGNVGLTQAARIEANLQGIALNTDFIDNSGGVNCSDLEVNIKLFLYNLKNKKQNINLSKLQKEVVELVLKNNKNQNLALNMYEKLQEKFGANYFKEIIAILTKNHILNLDFYENYYKFSIIKSNEKLTDITDVATNIDIDINKIYMKDFIRDFTRPELAIILSSIKMHLNNIIKINENMQISHTKMIKILKQYYPKSLRRIKNLDYMDNLLKNEIVLSVIINKMVNTNSIDYIAKYLR